MSKLKAYPCGTDVVTKVGKMPGKITAFVTRFTIISYEITYFDGSEFKTVWMNEAEYTVTSGVTQEPIGFHKTAAQ